MFERRARIGTLMALGLLGVGLPACSGRRATPMPKDPGAVAVRATLASLPTADPARAGGPPPPAAAPGKGDAVSGRIWIVSTLGVQDPPVLPDTELTLQLMAGGASGSAGCNTFAGSYVAGDGRLRIDRLAISQMMCAAPEGVMAQESAYLGVLGSATGYRIESGQLLLLAPDGAVLARFVEAGSAVPGTAASER